MQEKNMGHICPIGRSGVNNDSDFLILKLCWIVIHHWKGLENTVSEHFSLQF